MSHLMLVRVTMGCCVTFLSLDGDSSCSKCTPAQFERFLKKHCEARILGGTKASSRVPLVALPGRVFTV